MIEYRNSIFGKNGQLTTILKGLKELSAEDRSVIGSLANGLRDRLTEAFDNRRDHIKEAYIQARLDREYRDVTGPLSRHKGSLHPITQVRHEVENIFRRMGFDIYESMEITTEALNFDALNIAKTHPARDMQDTFWLEGEGHVLATQTSCMQNLLLKHKTPPIRAIIPGRVFRNEDVDATHDNTFYQIEGLVIDKNIGMNHLKYTIESMLE